MILKRKKKEGKVPRGGGGRRILGSGEGPGLQTDRRWIVTVSALILLAAVAVLIDSPEAEGSGEISFTNTSGITFYVMDKAEMIGNMDGNSTYTLTFSGNYALTYTCSAGMTFTFSKYDESTGKSWWVLKTPSSGSFKVSSYSEKADRDGPSVTGSMSHEASDGKYGRINTTSGMQFSTSASGPWTDCTGQKVVDQGIYYVRYPTTETYKASSVTEVYVGPDRPDDPSEGDIKTLEYNGSPQQYLPDTLDKNWVDITCEWKTEPTTGEGYYTSTVDAKGVWSSKADEDKGAIIYKWKMVKATLEESDFLISSDSIEYDGKQHGEDGITVKLSGFAESDRNDMDAHLATDGAIVFADSDRINVGEYKFSLVIAATDHFEGGTIQIENSKLKIIQRPPVAADFKVTVYETTYNGSGQTATVTLNPTTYTTPQPDVSSMSTWLTWTVGGAAEQVNANETGYPIVVKINGSTNFANAEAITLTADDNESHHMFIIHKKELADSDVVISGNTATFDAKTHSPTVGLNATYKDIQPDTVSDWLTCKVGNQQVSDADSQINAGTYQIKVYVAESSTNFENPDAGYLTIAGWSTTDKWNLTISKKELSSTDFSVKYAADDTLTYKYENGAKVNHTPIVEFSDAAFETYYSDSNTGWTSPEKNRGWLTWQVGSSGHSQADAGTYAITAAIADNTNFVTKTSFQIDTMTIQRATLSASDFNVTPPTGKTYDGQAIGVTSIGLKSGDTSLTGLTWKYDRIDDETTADSDVSVSDAGTYQIKLYCTENTQTNYKVLDGLTADTWKFTISKATLTVVVDPTDCSYTGVYDGTSHPLKVTVSAIEGNAVTITNKGWTQDSGISGLRTDSTSVSVVQGGNEATLTWDAMHVCESGKVTWEAAAGNNYNVYKSTENRKDLSVKITPYELKTQTTDESLPRITVQEYEGVYDGNAHAFDVDFTLFSADTASEDGIQVTYGMTATADGEISSIEQRYYTETPVTAYYKLSYKEATSNFAKYGDYSFEAAQRSTIEIKKLQMKAEVTLDDDVLNDSEEGMSGTTEYNGQTHAFSARATNLMPEDAVTTDEAVVVYTLDGAEISAERLATVLGNVGTYEVGVKVSAKSDEGYSGSYIPFQRTVTVEVTNASVQITDFSYDTVTEGEPMIMKVTMESVGTLDEDIVITYRGQPLVTTCSILDNGDGKYTATVVYDTSRGDIPSGTLQTISVTYPGDENHKPSESIDQVIRMRSIGMPVIPKEGGDVPIDPEKKRIEVVTPAGDIGFEILDDDDAWEDGTVIIHVMMRYALENETILDADRTIVLETDGYRIHADGSRTPVKYRVTPSVSVDVPSGKKPVVTLYDTEGSTVGKPDVLTYTSDSATFQTDADGSLSLRIGVTFKSKMIPIPIPDEPVVPVIPETEEKDYTAAVAAACVFVLIAIIVLVMTRRSRD